VIGIYEAAPDGMTGHHPVHDPGGAEHGGIDHHRPRLFSIGPEQLGRERHEDDQRQVDEVEHHQPRVEAVERREQAMVDEPQAAQHGEADEVGGHVAPQPTQVAGEVGPAGVRHLRHLEVEDEQGDRDREHAVGEGDDARERDSLDAAGGRSHHRRMVARRVDGPRVASADRGPASLRYSKRMRVGLSRIRTTRAGTPATTALAGTSRVTTALVPTIALSPMVTPRSTHAP
jgi:hypothetical protein